MPHCEAPVIDGRCPFDRDALPEPGPTPATHFALSTAPDAATALLLPFAEHPWHSRVVAALREDAALSTADDGAEFVLVALPERLRPSVRDALAELLDLRAHDRRVHCGISCVYPGEYTAVLTSVFKQAHEVGGCTVPHANSHDTNNEASASDMSSGTKSDERTAAAVPIEVQEFSVDDVAGERTRLSIRVFVANGNVEKKEETLSLFSNEMSEIVSSCARCENAPGSNLSSVDAEPDGQTATAVPIEAKERNLDDVAAVCQLCRAGEFLQCFTVTDVACEWLGSWLESAKKGDRHSESLRYELQSLCTADLGQPPRSVAEKLDPSSFSFARHPELDPTFLSATLRSTECSFGYLGRIPRAIPDVVLDYIPPCALPHRVVETQLPCWLKTEDHCSVYHKRRFPLQTSARKYILYVGKTSRTRDRKKGTLCFSTWNLLRPFLPFKADGIVLPPGIPDYAPVFRSALFSSATSITFPGDFHDEHWGGFTRHTCEKVKQLDFSQTQVTAIPSACYRRPELVRVYLPATLKTIHAGAFSCCPKLQEVTGLRRGVTIEPTAFAFSHALPVSTFKDLPAAPSCSTSAARQSAPKKRPRND